MKSFEPRWIRKFDMDNEEAALETIDEFFRIFHLVEAQEEIDTIQQAVHKIPGFLSGEKGEDLLYFCEKLKGLIAAAHQLRKVE